MKSRFRNFIPWDFTSKPGLYALAQMLLFVLEAWIEQMNTVITPIFSRHPVVVASPRACHGSPQGVTPTGKVGLTSIVLPALRVKTDRNGRTASHNDRHDMPCLYQDNLLFSSVSRYPPLRCGHRPREVVDRQVSGFDAVPLP